MTDATAVRAAAVRAKAYLESISPADVPRLGTIYTEDAYFRDPFNEVTGVSEIARIFGAMFEHLDDVRFTILETVADDGGAMLTWDMSYRVRKWRPHQS